MLQLSLTPKQFEHGSQLTDSLATREHMPHPAFKNRRIEPPQQVRCEEHHELLRQLNCQLDCQLPPL